MPEGEEPGTGKRLRRLAARPQLACAVVFAIALVVRAIFLIEVATTPYLTSVGPLNDSAYYHRRASAIAKGDLLGDAPDFLGPLYSYAVGAVYAVAGPNPGVVRALQAGLGALTCAFLVVIGRRFFSPGVGLLAGLILACHSLHVYYTSLLLPTVLVTFLNLAVLLAFAPREAGMGRARSFGAGLLIGLASLAKSNALLLLPLGLLGVCAGAGDVPARRRALLVALLALGFALPVAPIVVRDHALSGAWVPLVTSGGLNLYKGNGPEADGTHVNVSGFDRFEIGAYLGGPLDPVEVTKGSPLLARLTLEHVSRAPAESAALLLRKLALFFNAFEPVIRDQYHFARQEFAMLRLSAVSTGAVLILGLTGLVLSWSRRRRLVWLYAMIAVQVASFVLVFVLARYRLVAIACFAVFAAAQLAAWADALDQRAWRKLLVSGGVVLAAALLVHLPLAGQDPRRGYADQLRFLARHAAWQGRADEALAHYAAIDPDEWYSQTEYTRRLRRFSTGIEVADLLQTADQTEAATALLEAVIAEIDARPASEQRRLTRTRERARRHLEALQSPPDAIGPAGARG
jgi:4-amino-4-deoxy-L-arabinose transferase-like glycosyltransferase